MLGAHLEDLNDAVQLDRLRFRLFDGGVRLFNKRCIVLRHLVHLSNGDVDLGDGR